MLRKSARGAGDLHVVDFPSPDKESAPYPRGTLWLCSLMAARGLRVVLADLPAVPNIVLRNSESQLSHGCQIKWTPSLRKFDGHNIRFTACEMPAAPGPALQTRRTQGSSPILRCDALLQRRHPSALFRLPAEEPPSTP